MTIKDDIFNLIDQNHNVLLYQQEDKLKAIYEEKTRENLWAYITNPNQGKHALEVVIKTLDNDIIIKNDSAAQILEKIEKLATCSDDKVLIFINYFEKLNRRTLPYYQEFLAMNNLYLISNIVEDEEVIDEDFLQNFVIVDNERYSSNRSHSINVKYTLLLVLSLFVFLLFLRIQLSITSFLVSTLWFTLLMYRSFYYITR